MVGSFNRDIFYGSLAFIIATAIELYVTLCVPLTHRTFTKIDKAVQLCLVIVQANK